jgi:hypothetical protein
VAARAEPGAGAGHRVRRLGTVQRPVRLLAHRGALRLRLAQGVHPVRERGCLRGPRQQGPAELHQRCGEPLHGHRLRQARRGSAPARPALPASQRPAALRAALRPERARPGSRHRGRAGAAGLRSLRRLHAHLAAGARVAGRGGYADLWALAAARGHRSHRRAAHGAERAVSPGGQPGDRRALSRPAASPAPGADDLRPHRDAPRSAAHPGPRHLPAQRRLDPGPRGRRVRRLRPELQPERPGVEPRGEPAGREGAEGALPGCGALRRTALPATGQADDRVGQDRDLPQPGSVQSPGREPRDLAEPRGVADRAVGAARHLLVLRRGSAGGRAARAGVAPGRVRAHRPRALRRALRAAARGLPEGLRSCTA